jgi:hypothetical protein
LPTDCNYYCSRSRAAGRCLVAAGCLSRRRRQSLLLVSEIFSDGFSLQSDEEREREREREKDREKERERERERERDIEREREKERER